jgi:CheY-like chemotaxis protein
MMNKTRVLLVEDETNTIELMRLELEVLGYEVTVAKNGEEGVEMAVSLLPDIIVMDILMPRMDGLQAASRIRENPKTKDIPILAATAKAMPGDREKCLAAGCDDYIAKPFGYKQLGAAVERLLKER